MKLKKLGQPTSDLILLENLESNSDTLHDRYNALTKKYNAEAKITLALQEKSAAIEKELSIVTNFNSLIYNLIE